MRNIRKYKNEGWFYLVFNRLGSVKTIEKLNRIEKINYFEKILFLMQNDYLMKENKLLFDSFIYIKNQKIYIVYLSDIMSVSNFEVYGRLTPGIKYKMKFKIFNNYLNDYLKFSQHEINDRVNELVLSEKLNRQYFIFGELENNVFIKKCRYEYNKEMDDSFSIKFLELHNLIFVFIYPAIAIVVLLVLFDNEFNAQFNHDNAVMKKMVVLTLYIIFTKFLYKILAKKWYKKTINETSD